MILFKPTIIRLYSPFLVLIWNQAEIRLVEIQSENGKYNLVSVDSRRNKGGFVYVRVYHTGCGRCPLPRLNSLPLHCSFQTRKNYNRDLLLAATGGKLIRDSTPWNPTNITSTTIWGSGGWIWPLYDAERLCSFLCHFPQSSPCVCRRTTLEKNSHPLSERLASLGAKTGGPLSKLSIR